MKKFHLLLQYLTFAALGFLLFLVFFQDRVQLPAFWQVLGRTHVMWLHFPIAWLLLVLVLDFQSDNSWTATNFWQVLRTALLLITLLTAIAGMLLQLEGTISGNNLMNHRRLGIALALGVLLYGWGEKYLARNIWLRRIAAALLIGVLILTAHFGASLTHGENYVTAPLEKKSPALTDVQQAEAWRDVIYPVLKTKCGKCHMGGVQKGGLSMNDSLSIWKGGKEGKTLVAGNFAVSNLLQRILLPVNDKKHMPEPDEPPLTQDEMALLRSWILAGAPFGEKIYQRNESDSFRQFAWQQVEKSITESAVVYDFPAADAKKIQALNDHYRKVQPLGKNVPALAVSFFSSKEFSSARLSELNQVKEQVTELNLARMPVKATDLEFISGLRHLKKLNLNFTPVNDSLLLLLGRSASLESLAITGTKVTVGGIQQLLNQHRLHELFMWDLGLSDVQLKQLKQKFPSVRFEAGFRGGDTILLRLNDPLITAPEGIFTSELKVPIRHVIAGVDLYYTLDGSIPDSTTKKYIEPLVIQRSGTLKARAYKRGWLPSNVVSYSFLQAGYRISQTELLSPADEKYREHATTVLQDFDLADPTDFSTKWLGYQKNDAQIIFDLGEEKMLREVSVNSLTNTAAHIFPPVFVKVWGSMDGKNWRMLQTFTPEKATSTTSPGANLLKISFAPVKVRRVKMQVHPLPALPAWHVSKGLPAWFFVSEVICN